MTTLQEKLASAIRLRESEKHQEAHQLRLGWHTEFSNDPQVNYRSTWIHHLLGFEREAIQTGLYGDDLKSALLGIGSTYRCIGEYQRSIATFQQALRSFPNAHKFNVFLAMAYYNIGEHAKAMELLLTRLVNTSNDEGVLRYQRPIRFYSDKLNQTW